MQDLKKFPRIKIIVENPMIDSNLSIDMSCHSTIGDWMNTFKTILIHQTFHEDLIKELFENYDF